MKKEVSITAGLSRRWYLALALLALDGCKSGGVSAVARALIFSSQAQPNAVTQMATTVVVDLGIVPVGATASLPIQIAAAGAPVALLSITTASSDGRFSWPLTSQSISLQGVTNALTFSPMAVGAYSQTYALVTDLKSDSVYTVTVTARAVSFAVAASPDPLDFGPVLVNQRHSLPVTITNLSDAGTPLLAAVVGVDATLFNLATCRRC